MKNQQDIDTRRSIKIDLETWQALKRREADTQRPLILQLRDLVMSGEQPPPLARRPGDGDEGENYCLMVKECISAGKPWAGQIRGVVSAIYEKMKRETG